LLFDTQPAECSAQVRQRVIRIRQRCAQRRGCLNSALNAAQLHTHCRPDAAGRKLLNSAASTLGLSRRACDRTLRVARTIADMDDCNAVQSNHVAEALGYRPG